METLLDNRYRVIRTLGSGGFGETYLAEDSQMPSNRRCVIKQLKPIQNNPDIYQLVKERFQREAAILEDLGSSNDQIPTLYAYFQSNSQFYVVQEWVEGDTLTSKVQQQGVFTESAVREILVNLLPVLEYVHSKRIIHRDIKPDNIILRHRDGKPVLIDFGAVRESMGTVMNSQGNPTSSIVIGTPGYMPSEQAAGRPVYSSDLYSLGLTAIYLLTGKQPQQLETNLQTGEIIWREHALSISPTLAGVIDRAIAYHPRERFMTAREMLTALQAGVVAFPPTVPYQPPATPTAPYQQPPIPTTPANPQTLPNTVAVSPGTPLPPQPINHNNNSRGILLGSLIAGGLIGASVLIGFALTRPNQNISQETSSLSGNTGSNTSQTTAPTPSPIPSTTTTPSAENQDVEHNTPPTPIFSSPKNSQPTTTPTDSPTTSTPTPTNQPEVDRPSPPEAIQNYYATINQGQYSQAWNLLSPSYQNNTKLHPEGYRSYLDWWGGQVERVDVTQASLVDSNSETATVDAELNYTMKTGKQVVNSIRFSLVWDAANNKWLINATK